MIDPVITKEFLTFVMKDTLPGCRLKVKERMGGITASMAVWHYELSISLTLTKISHVDKIGEATLTLTYLPKELKTEKPAGTIILRKVSTTNPDYVKQFVEGVRAYLKGIVVAINVATSDPQEKEANIFFDIYEDD